jgi:hypothetical protein
MTPIKRLRFALWMLSNPWNWEEGAEPCEYARAVLDGADVTDVAKHGLTEPAAKWLVQKKAKGELPLFEGRDAG